MSEADLLQEHKLLMSANVQRNATIVTPENSGYRHMLHISKDTGIREFEPIIGMRQSKTEDRTVPRVTVAPFLLGCFIGYAAGQYDFLDGSEKSTKKSTSNDFKGGYKIYGFEYQACLKPNGRLVYDADRSCEHWLVTYSSETAKYQPIEMGKVFIRAIEFFARSGDAPEKEVTAYVEVVHPDGVQLTPKNVLAKGFWRIVGNLLTDDGYAGVELEAVPISAGEYHKAKTQTAALLSYELPSVARW